MFLSHCGIHSVHQTMSSPHCKDIDLTIEPVMYLCNEKEAQCGDLYGYGNDLNIGSCWLESYSGRIHCLCTFF